MSNSDHRSSLLSSRIQYFNHWTSGYLQ